MIPATVFCLSSEHVHQHTTGLPTFNVAREAYKLSPVSSFAEMPGDNAATKALLFGTYGGDIENLDAFVGAVAEESTTGKFFGDLLQVRLSSSPPPPTRTSYLPWFTPEEFFVV